MIKRNLLNKFMLSKRRLPATLRRILKFGWPHALYSVDTDHGLRFGVDPEAYIDTIVGSTGFYEPEVLGEVINSLQDGDLFWDVGANFGLISLAVKKICPNTEVVSFEPHPLMATRLLLNSRLNNLSVKLIQVALGDDNKIADLSYQMTGNPGISSLKPWADAKYEGTISVWVSRADVVIGLEGSVPNVMKIDTEGTEYNVLIGLGKVLEDRKLRAIIFESDSPEHFHPISKLLVSHDFTIIGIPSSELDRITNFVATRAANLPSSSVNGTN